MHQPDSGRSLAVRPREAARLLGISERTLFSWTRDGIIPATKIGRVVVYSVDRLRAFLDQQTAETKGGEHVAD